mgnify:CR=1 FL=1
MTEQQETCRSYRTDAPEAYTRTIGMTLLRLEQKPLRADLSNYPTIPQEVVTAVYTHNIKWKDEEIRQSLCIELDSGTTIGIRYWAGPEDVCVLTLLDARDAVTTLEVPGAWVLALEAQA